MAFKMRSGNKPAFKSIGSGDSPMEVGKWTGWMAQKQKFIGDEIQARRKAKGGGKEDDEEETKTKTTTTKPKPKPKPKPESKPEPKEEQPEGRVEHAASKPELQEFVKEDAKGNPKLDSYREAWEGSRFSRADGQRKDRFGNQYEDSEEGFGSFVDASEEWWKSEQAKKDKGLNIDSQTGKQSTHEVW